mmetsp:Transcript_6514/g.40451  ORF Transcript_6514/g.40451 Transcript_6514/m.40451 type:complete len:98 (-) Transcript_6514:756-1049(-)
MHCSVAASLVYIIPCPLFVLHCGYSSLYLNNYMAILMLSMCVKYVLVEIRTWFLIGFLSGSRSRSWTPRFRKATMHNVSCQCSCGIVVVAGIAFQVV